MESNATPVSNTLAPAASFFRVAADLIGEVQRVIGSEQVRLLRVKVGDRVVKEISIKPMTSAATIGVVVLAVLVTSLVIETDNEPTGSVA